VRALRLVAGAALLGAVGASCVGTTGSALVTFNAAAAGPKSVVQGQPYTFHTARGYTVTLDKAIFHVGGVYLNIARPESGAQSTDCILPGLYVGEVTTGLDVDTLSPNPQPFPVKGEGTQTAAVTGEVWLTHGDVNDPMDSAPILTVHGTAISDSKGTSYPFQGSITIGENKVRPSQDPSQPSLHPICKERIVTGIEVTITPKNGGSLLLRIDPQGWFTNVNFSQLPPDPSGSGGYLFDDTLNGQPNKNLYLGIHANSGVYDFEWVDSSTP
jgi:hypothetical protein